jgi:hypothetical protein
LNLSSFFPRSPHGLGSWPMTGVLRV